MGCGGSVSEDMKAQRVTAKQIEQDMRQRKRFLDAEIKLLLLGAGESGKSTIAKQMKIIHLSGYSEQEKMAFREIVFTNIVNNMKSILGGMDRLGIGIAEAANAPRRDAILSAPGTITSFPSEMVADIAALWADQGVQRAFQNRNHYQLSDSAEYYFSALGRISAPNYVPDEQDILRSRVKTTGIQEIVFQTHEVNFRMVDVGGQRSERKKWIHCFQDVTAVIFCVALSEYDLKLYEDETVGRTEESLKLFDEICNSKWFHSTSIILFLNKKDLFAEKIQKTDLSICFPEYTGGKDLDKAVKFMRDKFVNLNRNHETKQIYPYVTVGTDTNNVSFVFQSVRDTILQHALDAHGF